MTDPADRPDRGPARFACVTLSTAYEDGTAVSTSWQAPAEAVAAIGDMIRKRMGEPYCSRLLPPEGRERFVAAYDSAGVIDLTDFGQIHGG